MVNALLANKNKKVLLATAMIAVVAKNGNVIALKALIDQGSQNAFISENAAQLLNLKRDKISATISGIGQVQQNASHSMSVQVKPRFSSEFVLDMKAIVLKKTC